MLLSIAIFGEGCGGAGGGHLEVILDNLQLFFSYNCLKTVLTINTCCLIELEILYRISFTERATFSTTMEGG